MKVELLRTIDRVAGVWICRALSIAAKIFPDRPGSGPPRRILVILLSEMGSLVLAYPMFQRLKEKYPDASISVLLFEKNREVLEILGVVPAANILTIRDRSLPGFMLDSLRVLVRLRRLSVDAVVDCELFARISSIFAYLSGARLRAGFAPYTQEGLYRGTFINRPVLYNPYQHISRQFLSLVEAFESTSRPFAKRMVGSDQLETPKFEPPEDELEQIRERLHRDFPTCRNRELVLIYPSGGLLPIRAWPKEAYCTLAKLLIGEDYLVGIIGLQSDKALALEIIERCDSPAVLDLTGYTRSVRELMMLFYHAALLITNDGGPGQFAAMTPIPTIVLFGPESPLLYGSHSANAYFFYRGMSCSPCLTAYNHRNSPCDGDNQCLKDIVPEQVFAKAREMAAGSSGSDWKHS